ncbi:hypothetical protein [Mycolicibacterium confluentis]|uniref:Uncharacterized protein n=1 Tax=Mycolicibacterium confluentis TaxID=28047 RepID=A0A7I7XU46_9MYCO|nr:hypothetical protein [Mycolicibacterium confluentis]MCV7320794.1 hypothetical protein [Mycolicibacterium confluentis]ORV27151.1 hypothetical protein AWB99_20565 [Mycolicibacterium confluentis]BBZ32806.1 hypothetical protein MCNF_14110 [Mycolicibacterium confluentis]
MTAHAAGGRDNTVLVAKLGLVGAIGAALITAVPQLTNLFSSDDDGHLPIPAQIEWSPFGQVKDIWASGQDINISGVAAEDVERLVVTIGPRPSGGKDWVAEATLKDGEWKAVVPTDAALPQNARLTVNYWIPDTARGAAPMTFRLDPPTPAPPSLPADPVECAALYGADACFTGPGWQQPSVYQSG